jgi:hypothetical protein
MIDGGLVTKDTSHIEGGGLNVTGGVSVILGGLSITDGGMTIEEGGFKVTGGLTVEDVGLTVATDGLRITGDSNSGLTIGSGKMIIGAGGASIVAGGMKIDSGDLTVSGGGVQVTAGGLVLKSATHGRLNVKGGITVGGNGLVITQDGFNITTENITTLGSVTVQQYGITVAEMDVDKDGLVDVGDTVVHSGGAWLTGHLKAMKGLEAGSLSVIGGVTLTNSGLTMTHMSVYNSGIQVDAGQFDVESGLKVVGGFQLHTGTAKIAGGLKIRKNSGDASKFTATLSSGHTVATGEALTVVAGGFVTEQLTVTAGGLTVGGGGVDVTGGLTLSDSSLVVDGGKVCVLSDGMSVGGKVDVTLTSGTAVLVKAGGARFFGSDALKVEAGGMTVDGAIISIDTVDVTANGLNVVGGMTAAQLDSVGGGLTVGASGVDVTGGLTVDDAGLDVEGAMTVYNSNLVVDSGILNIESGLKTSSGAMTVYSGSISLDEGLTVNGPTNKFAVSAGATAPQLSVVAGGLVAATATFAAGLEATGGLCVSAAGLTISGSTLDTGSRTVDAKIGGMKIAGTSSTKSMSGDVEITGNLAVPSPTPSPALQVAGGLVINAGGFSVEGTGANGKMHVTGGVTVSGGTLLVTGGMTVVDASVLSSGGIRVTGGMTVGQNLVTTKTRVLSGGLHGSKIIYKDNAPSARTTMYFVYADANECEPNDGTYCAKLNGTGQVDSYPSSFPRTTAATEATFAGIGTSDQRIKKNIRGIDRPLERLKMMKGYYYKWKDAGKYDPLLKMNDKRRHIGVIAQEVQKAIPELVDEFETEVDGKKERYLQVHYKGLLPLVVEGIKELSERVDKCLEVRENMMTTIRQQMDIVKRRQAKLVRVERSLSGYYGNSTKLAYIKMRKLNETVAKQIREHQAIQGMESFVS